MTNEDLQIHNDNLKHMDTIAFRKWKEAALAAEEYATVHDEGQRCLTDTLEKIHAALHFEHQRAQAYRDATASLRCEVEALLDENAKRWTIVRRNDDA